MNEDTCSTCSSRPAVRGRAYCAECLLSNLSQGGSADLLHRMATAAPEERPEAPQSLPQAAATNPMF